MVVTRQGEAQADRQTPRSVHTMSVRPSACVPCADVEKSRLSWLRDFAGSLSGSLVHLGEHCVEAAQTAKPRTMCDLGHRKVRLIQKALCSLHATCSRDLGGTPTKMLLK